MNIKITLAILSVFMIFLSPAAGFAGPVETMEQARELLRQADLSRGNLGGIEWDIDIESRTTDRVQENTLHVKVKGDNCLAQYESPRKVKGRKLLMKDRNMWFIKPGLSKPVPISPRQKLLGGASNGDIASTNYAGDYTIEQFETDAVDGTPCIRYELKAKSKKVTYDRIKYWVSIEQKTGLKAEFFTLTGKKFKTATFEYDHSIENEGVRRPFVSKMQIFNALVKTDVTTMVYDNIRISDVPASAFNLNLLVR